MADRWSVHYPVTDAILRPYMAKTVTIGASGNNTVHTPSGGTGLFLQYLCLSADGANVADVTAAVRWSGGADLYKLSLKPGAIWARNIGAGRRALRGAIDQPLLVNLSAAQAVHVSIEGEDM